MLSPKSRRNIYRIIPFGLFWLLFSGIYSLLERGLLGKLSYYPSTGNPYSFFTAFIITITSALITGIGIGALEVLLFNKLFIQRSFAEKIIYKTIIYLSIIILFLLTLTTISNTLELHKSIFDPQVWSNVSGFFFNFSFWSVEIYISAIIAVSLFYSEVSDNIGLGVLNNFFTGKYHTPKEEERIFIFLDMKSSTTIAEKLGHVRYFEMLRQYYADLSDPIINHAGEVYQYVGDEIVVSWTLKNGLTDKNCIRCFFTMKESLKKQSSKYKEQFDVIPEFKAGIHSGKVTTGEIGTIKKEIIFTGDVLNTTARIQALCNSYQVDLLISEHLINQLNLSDSFKTKALGENELRGKDEKVRLFTIE